MPFRGFLFMKLFLLILATIFLTSDIHAQKEANVWVFGHGVGLDFNGGSPAPVIAARDLFAYEGSASICDANGSLLFYTEGSYIWNRNHQLMPNGQNLTGMPSVTAAGLSATSSTSFGSVIIPFPDQEQKYYVFSLTSEESAGPGKLFYSVVDMNLAGGLGDIVGGQKGILIDSGLSEQLTAVAGDRCNIWLIAQTKRGAAFKAYNINYNGIDPEGNFRLTGGAQGIGSDYGTYPSIRTFNFSIRYSLR